MTLPMLGYELALLVQQVPAQRNLTLRLVEPLGAPEEPRNARGRIGADIGCGAAAERRLDRDDDVRAGGGPRGARSRHTSRSRPASTSRSSACRAPASRAWWACCWAGTARPGTCRRRPRARRGGARGAAAADGLGRAAVYLWNRSLARTCATGCMRSRATPPERSRPPTRAVRRGSHGLQTPLGESGACCRGARGSGCASAAGCAADARAGGARRALPRPRPRAASDLLARARRRWAEATLLYVTHDIGETDASRAC